MAPRNRNSFDLKVASKLGGFEEQLKNHAIRFGNVEKVVADLAKTLDAFHDETENRFDEGIRRFDQIDTALKALKNPSVKITTLAKLTVSIVTFSVVVMEAIDWLRGR